MIPSANPILGGELTFAEPSSRTFRLEIEGDFLFGMTDAREAMEQAIYLALETERYQWVIFSWNYGAELEALFGMPISWVIPEVKRRITEALTRDTRITGVDSFTFEIGKGKLLVAFMARTIYGEIPIQKEVRV